MDMKGEETQFQLDRKSLLLVSLLAEGGLGLIGLLLLGSSRTEVLSGISLTWMATVYALLLCLPMLGVLYVAMRSVWKPFSRLKIELEEKIQPIFANCKLVDLAFTSLLAGLGEELFFRGWMQGLLTNKFGLWVGIVLTSLVFGLAHYISKEYVIYAALTGIYLGLIYQVSGNLYIVMGIHALYDFIALLYLVAKGKNRGMELEDKS